MSDRTGAGLPADWERLPISQLTVRTKQRDPRRTPAAPFRYVDVSSVSNTSFTISEVAELIGADAPSRARKEIKTDDVLFATVRPTLKRVALVPAELDGQIASTGFMILRADRSRVLPRYLYTRLLTDDFIKRMGELERGASYPAVRDSDVLNEALPVPPLPEQQKIAAVLGLVQRAIAQQERLLLLTAELKKTLLHQLFSQGLRNEPQKQTDLGLLPRSWELVEIGCLGSVVTGSTPSTKVAEYYSPPEIDFIAPADIGQTRDVYESQRKISRSGLESVRSLPAHAVMCVCIGSSIGKVGMTVKQESATNQQINSILCDQSHDPHFVYYLLARFSAYWRGFATFGPVPILSKGRFETVKVGIPATKGEELKIAEGLKALDAKAEVHMRKCATLRALLRTLLDKLMTAQIRVHHLNLPELNLNE
jgi:type I restriction enzyme S subunit